MAHNSTKNKLKKCFEPGKVANALEKVELPKKMLNMTKIFSKQTGNKCKQIPKTGSQNLVGPLLAHKQRLKLVPKFSCLGKIWQKIFFLKEI